MEEKFLSGNEAAEYLGVHPQTVKNWRKAGRLKPVVEKNNLTLYTQSYLDQFSSRRAEAANKERKIR